MVFLRLSSGPCFFFWVESDSAASEPGSGSGGETASEVESEYLIYGASVVLGDVSGGVEFESLDEGFTRDLGSQGTYPRRLCRSMSSAITPSAPPATEIFGPLG